MKAFYLSVFATFLSILVLGSDPSKRTNVAFTTVKFLASDGMTITADYHEINSEAPIIVLCHQANFSRGEYIDIAAQLNSFGFNCFAVDLRSGKNCNGLVNETAKMVKERGRPDSYLDAEQDILDAIDHVTMKHQKQDVMLWGSSYSASLALKIANENDKVSSVIAYSPGEYFDNLNIKEAISSLNKPCYVTSSKSETELVGNLIADLSKVEHFIPEGRGVHGSKVLWRNQPDNGEYWASIYMYLKQFLPEGK